jgi:acetyltransferase-like isoleucine patch superfamily enzyme
MKMGDRISLHEFVYIDAAGGISIGNDVSIAHGCSIVSFEHGWSDINVPIKYNPIISKPVSIGSDVWIGCGVRILAGAKIGNRVVVAAGSVVKGVLAPGGVYAGSPAKRIKEI